MAIGAIIVNFDIKDDYIEVEASVDTVDRTGVEMEALTAVSTAALTVYDMVKAVQKDMEIGAIRLTFKDGGKSGRFENP